MYLVGILLDQAICTIHDRACEVLYNELTVARLFRGGFEAVVFTLQVLV